MESKLILLLVFVSLAYGSYVPSLKVDYGLCEKEADVLQQIIVNQELIRTTGTRGCKTLFGAIFNLEGKTDDICDKIAEAKATIKTAVDLSLNLDVLALGKSCSVAVKVTRKALHAKLDNVFAGITDASKLARSGNCSGEQIAIETYGAAVQKDWKNLIEMRFDTMETCANTTDADTLAVIRYARKKSLSGGIYTINTIFNAIKIYAAAFPVKCGDVTLISDITDLIEKTLASVKKYIELRFSTLRALYINFLLKKCRIVSGVALSQYAETVSFVEYMDAYEGIFGEARRNLRRIALRLYEDVSDIYSATNVSLAKVIAAYDTGDNIILDFLDFVNPDASSEIAAARKSLHISKVEATGIFFNTFHVAATRGRNHSETLNFIETTRKATISPADDYIQWIFSLIRNNRAFDRTTEAKLEFYQNVTLHGAVNITHKFFDAAIILANAAYRGVVSQKDYDAIQVLVDEANDALAASTQGVTAAGLLVLEVIHKCKIYCNRT